MTVSREIDFFFGISPTVPDVFFLFVLGVAVLTLWTKRPLVEALPAAGISASGLILDCFPLILCCLPSWMARPRPGAAALCDGDYLGGGYGGLFCWTIDWQVQTGAASESQENLGGDGCEFSWIADCRGCFCAVHDGAACGICWRWRRWGMWRGKSAICWNRRTSGARGLRIRAVFCRGMAACLTELMRLSLRFRLSGIIGSWSTLLGHRPLWSAGACSRFSVIANRS